MRSRLPIIVGGCHRSGTSLFRRLLNAHSGIYCGPEVKFFRDFFGDYFADPLAHLRYAASARTMIGEAELLKLLGRGFVELHEVAAAKAGKRRWADKCPENALYLDAWHALLGEDWLFVHAVRHPLDTLASMQEADFALTLPAGIQARIAFWRRYTVAGLNFGTAHPERYLRVNYDDLTRRPEEMLRSIMSWLGEDFEPGQLDFNRRSHQTGLEDPKVSRTAQIHADSVGRWRADLPDDAAREIWAQCRDVWQLIDPADTDRFDEARA